MNCQEVQEKLSPLHDGELTPTEVARVEAALEGCPDCQEELNELRTVSALARDALTLPESAFALDGVFDGVMARLEAEGALRTAPAQAERRTETAAEPQPGAVQRLFDWMGELLRFEHPVAAMAMAAAVVAIVTGLVMTQPSAPGVQGPDGAPSVAGTDKAGAPAAVDPAPKPRREMEVEVVAGRNAASVESFEAASGRVVIDKADDSETPMVVWHIVDDNSTAAPEQGL